MTRSRSVISVIHFNKSYKSGKKDAKLLCKRREPEFMSISTPLSHHKPEESWQMLCYQTKKQEIIKKFIMTEAN